jgi:sugar lactone lactonase YvrE
MQRSVRMHLSQFVPGGDAAPLPLRILTLAAGLIVAVSDVACGGSAGGATTGAARSGGSSSPIADVVTNPFTLVGHWNAARLRLHDPADLAIGPEGDLYVTDRTQRVTEISPSGNVVHRWGSKGSGPRQFDFTSPDRARGWNVSASIAVGTDGRVYVSDSGNGRVEIFSSSGAFLGQLGSPGFGKLHFLDPGPLLVDRAGNVYVTDDGTETLSKYSPTGAFEWRIGGPTANDPDLRGHYHLVNTDPHGLLIVANDDAGRILYIDSHGGKVDAFGQGSELGASGTFRDGACDVSVDASGDMFVNGCEEPLLPKHHTEVFDRTRTLVGAWDGSPFSESPRLGPNGEIFALGFDGSILRLEVVLPIA